MNCDATTRSAMHRAPVLGGLLAIAVGLLSAEDSLAQVPLATASVMPELTARERIWDGTVEAVNQATVSAQTSGRVAEILYDVNDLVEAGSVIMRFTDAEQRAALRSAEASLQEAEARFSEADSEFRRIAAMFENETVARARYDQANANAEAARARLEAARSAVTAAAEQLDYTVVRAPYGGIVSERLVEVGELVRPGQPLMSGVALQPLRVRVDVPQSLIDPIRSIGQAYVYAGDERVAARRLTFFPVADPASNTFRVRVDLPEGGPTLYPGVFVKVGFVVGETQRLLIPESAVVHRSELTAVYRVTGDVVVLQQIRLGRRFGDRVEVLAGLAAGDEVAVDPVMAGVYLKEGGLRSE